MSAADLGAVVAALSARVAMTEARLARIIHERGDFELAGMV